METATSLEHEIDWETVFDDEVPCEAEHGSPHPAQWYAILGCTKCDLWETLAICDKVRKTYETHSDDLVDCICGITQVPFKTFIHGFKPVRG